MRTELQTLKAEILTDLATIAEIYAALDHCSIKQDDTEHLIVAGYYLHNLYCVFESIFQRVAAVFGNQLSEQAGWHADLLRRMTLDIANLRPRLISDQAYDCLDELRRFRHLFRSAYRLHLDADRLMLVYKKARKLEQIYRADLESFLLFLDNVIQADE